MARHKRSLKRRIKRALPWAILWAIAAGGAMFVVITVNNIAADGGITTTASSR